jgi:hypothetical protein
MFSNFGKNLQQNVAAVLMGCAFSSFGVHAYLWWYFTQTQPIEPNPQLGFIYSLNSHGHYFYLSATQSTQLWMCFYLFIPLAAISAIIHGPYPRKLPFEKYGPSESGNAIYLWISVLISGTFLWFASRPLAAILVARSVIL